MNEKYFKDNQKALRELANSEAGRHLLGIKDKSLIVKVAPNSFSQLIGFNGKRPVLKSTFYCYERTAKLLLPGVFAKEIALMGALEDKNNKLVTNIIENPYEAYLHFSDLEIKNYKYPQLYLTTSTFYTGAGDGAVRNTGAVWATVRGASTGLSVSGTGATFLAAYSGDNVNDYDMQRGFEPFLTSAIGDTDTIDSAVFSLWPTFIGDGASGSIVLILTTQADPTTLAVGDFDNLTLNSPAEGAARKTLASMTTGQYNDITLNATGLGWISKTSYTLLGTRERRDVDNVEPSSATVNRVIVSASEEAGTTQDPKLVVVHTSAGGAALFGLL